MKYIVEHKNISKYPDIEFAPVVKDLDPQFQMLIQNVLDVMEKELR